MSDLISRQDAIEAVGLNTWAGSRISQLPTIDAIPIEWIKNYARKICADDGGRYSSKAYGIDRMIYDWREEK